MAAHLFYYDAGKTESNVEVLVQGVKVLDGDFKQINCDYADPSCAFGVFTLERLAADGLASDDGPKQVKVEVFLDSVARDQRYLISSVRFGDERYTFDRFVTGEVKFVQDEPIGCMPLSETAMTIDVSLAEESYHVMEVSL